jgi:hypothetical protein
MKILVACEESQAVTIELRKLGHEAYSCDIEPCSGGHPEWHLQQDVLPLLNGGVYFYTMDGVLHTELSQNKWDMIIAFPPCTYLTVTGNRWFNIKRYGDAAIKRCEERSKAIEFFMSFINADCDTIAVENPVGIMSTVYRKPDYIDSPNNHGDAERKNICLWLKGLYPLTPTKIVKPNLYTYKDGRTDPNWHMSTISLNSKERARVRSKTFPGIAKAMAEQWGKEQQNG